MAVKPIGHTLSATSVVGQPLSRLFYRISHLRFLVDTGAAVSVIPPSPSERTRKHSLTLDTSISTYGSRSLTLNLGLRRTLHWVFIVRKPILGADFLHHFNLLVDVKNCKLLDNLTHLCVLPLKPPQALPCTLTAWMTTSPHFFMSSHLSPRLAPLAISHNTPHPYQGSARLGSSTSPHTRASQGRTP